MTLKSEKGYTILEVMIFLAITGVLFASAVVAIGGNQQNVEYTQTVRDFETQIKDVINDVSDGYYPPYSGGNCKKTTGGPSGDTVSIVEDASNSESPGTNQGCINIGKILMFNLGGNTKNFGLGTIVAANPAVGSSVPGDFRSLNPILAYSDNGIVDLTTTKPIRYGAKVTKIGDLSNSNNTYDSISIVNNFNSGVNGGDYKNGILVNNVYGHISLSGAFVSDKASYKSIVLDLKDNSKYRVNQEFYICLLTPSKKRARIMIGVDGVPTATASEFDLETTGDCPSV